MGNVLTEVVAGQCISDCSKYVLNSCHSKCGISNCCECDIQTDKVELESSESETEIETSCFKFHQK